VRRRGQGAAVPQLNSPGWGAPEKGPQTIESDRYKLGLFILRCLTPGVNAQNRDPEKAATVLDRDGLQLLRLALGEDPAARPSGKTWVMYLDAHIAASGGVRSRTQPAAAPAPPPKIARRASSIGGRRATARAATSPPAVRGVGAAPAAGRGIAPPPARSPAQQIPVGGFGLMPSRATPLSGAAAKATARLVFAVVVGVAIFVMARGSFDRSAFTAVTSTTAARRPTTVAPSVWPTATDALSAAARDAVAAAIRTAGPGWEPTGFTSTAERASADAPARPVWRVDLVRKDAATAGSVPFRTYRIDAGGNITLVQNTSKPLPASGLPTTMVSSWPIALGFALDRVATPTRQGGPILVRFGCSADDPSVCGWELRFLTSAANPTEFERVYVTDNGSAIMPDPSWATPR